MMPLVTSSARSNQREKKGGNNCFFLRVAIGPIACWLGRLAQGCLKYLSTGHCLCASPSTGKTMFLDTLRAMVFLSYPQGVAAPLRLLAGHMLRVMRVARIGSMR